MTCVCPRFVIFRHLKSPGEGRSQYKAYYGKWQQSAKVACNFNDKPWPGRSLLLVMSVFVRALTEFTEQQWHSPNEFTFDTSADMAHSTDSGSLFLDHQFCVFQTALPGTLPPSHHHTASIDDLSLGKWKKKKKMTKGQKRHIGLWAVGQTAINLMMALAIRHWPMIIILQRTVCLPACLHSQCEHSTAQKTDRRRQLGRAQEWPQVGPSPGRRHKSLQLVAWRHTQVHSVGFLICHVTLFQVTGFTITRCQWCLNFIGWVAGLSFPFQSSRRGHTHSHTNQSKKTAQLDK